MNSDTNALIQLPDVAETALLTFYCHAIESQSPSPILGDEKSVEITRRLNPLIKDSPSRLLRSLAAGKLSPDLVVHITLRAKQYDQYVRDFLVQHPDGLVVNIGCGMDSRFERIDNGKVVFFDLDLPEIIALKRSFYRENERYRMLASSVFDYAWMDLVAVKTNRPILFLAEGVFMYLNGGMVKALILELQSRFPESELVCEVANALFTKKPWNRLVAMKLHDKFGIAKGASFEFGLRDTREMETWHSGIQFLDDWSYFDTRHPRLGWVGTLGRFRFMREVQLTVHYRLN